MDLNSKMFVRKNGIETAEMGEEIGMLDIESGNYYVLNGIASDLWFLLETPMTLGQLIDELCLIYDVDQQTCKVESLEFINNMVQSKLIQVIDSEF